MPIKWGNSLIRISEMPRGVALSCYRELDYMMVFWSSANIDEGRINQDIATLVTVNSPVAVLQSDKIIKSGDVVIDLEDGDSFALTLPLTKDQIDALPLKVAAMWIEEAAKANEYFLSQLSQFLRQKAQTIKESLSANGQSNGQSTIPPETRITGT